MIPTVRKVACSLGLKYYFTGKPCKFGHVEKRITSSGVCVACSKWSTRKIRLIKEGKWETYQQATKERFHRTGQKEKIKDYKKSARQDPIKGPIIRAKERAYVRANPLKYLFAVARKRARKRGLDFTITIDDLSIPFHCPIFGVKIGPVGSKHAPSIDRINNSFGYVPGNVKVISRVANRWKSDLDKEHAKRFLIYFENGAYR